MESSPLARAAWSCCIRLQAAPRTQPAQRPGMRRRPSSRTERSAPERISSYTFVRPIPSVRAASSGRTSSTGSPTSTSSVVTPPSLLPEITVRWHRRPPPGLRQRGLPSEPVGDHVQQSPGVFHVVRVGRGDGFPGVPGRVGCRNAERPQQPFLAVGAVVGQGLAGPLAGDQHPAPGVAEVVGVVGFALAPARGPGRAGRSWAGCRSGASSRTAASTAGTSAPRPAGRRGRAARRYRPGGSRRRAW